MLVNTSFSMTLLSYESIQSSPIATNPTGPIIHRLSVRPMRFRKSSKQPVWFTTWRWSGRSRWWWCGIVTSLVGVDIASWPWFGNDLTNIGIARFIFNKFVLMGSRKQETQQALWPQNRNNEQKMNGVELPGATEGSKRIINYERGHEYRQKEAWLVG